MKSKPLSSADIKMLATLTLCANSNWIEQALAHAVLDLLAEVKRLEVDQPGKHSAHKIGDLKRHKAERHP